MKRVTAPSAEVRRKLDRFRALRNDPVATREFALTILPVEANPELLTAALRALGPIVRMEDHEALRDLYEYYAQDAKRRDAGGAIRVEILNVLCNLRNAEDFGLADQAASTVEHTPNGDGAAIRAAGLLLMGLLDPSSANMRAAQMLADEDADRMAAEPALTAARVLASNGETVALALYIQAHFEKGHAEVIAECLRGLSSVPADQIEALLGLCFSSRNEIVLLGLCDLIVEHEPDRLLTDAAGRIFRAQHQDEIFGYLVAAAVAHRRDDLIAALLAALKVEVSTAKRKIAAESLELAAPSPAVEEARALLLPRN